MDEQRVGVLALQGASAPHVEAFARLGVACRSVRDRAGLDAVTHLVLPGGESTTIDHLLRLFDLRERLLERARTGALALFGTCAGAILLGRGAPGVPTRPEPLALLEATILRNAYGRQRDSRQRSVHVEGQPDAHPAILIRAPRIQAVGPGARVLARFDDGEPAALEAPGLLATTFHPELTEDPWFHARFLGRC